MVWATPFSLAATKGMGNTEIVHFDRRGNDFDISLFSFPPGTEMFHFPGFASYAFRRKIL
jgi:hypothetical protein